MYILFIGLVAVKFIVILSHLSYKLISYYELRKRIKESGIFLLYTVITFSLGSMEILLADSFLDAKFVPNFFFTLKSLMIINVIMDLTNFHFYKELRDDNKFKTIFIYILISILCIPIFLLLISILYQFGFDKFYISIKYNLFVAGIIPLNFIISILSFQLLKSNNKYLINFIYIIGMLLTIIVWLSGFEVGLAYLYLHRITIIIGLLLLFYMKIKNISLQNCITFK